MNANITEQQTIEAIDWAASRLGTKVSGEQAVEYVTENYPGGWFQFVAEVCIPSEEQVPGLSDAERRMCRRDTQMEHGITFREYLGGLGYTANLWEVFQGSVRVGRYKSERAALKRIEALKAESKNG